MSQQLRDKPPKFTVEVDVYIHAQVAVDIDAATSFDEAGGYAEAHVNRFARDEIGKLATRVIAEQTRVDDLDTPTNRHRLTSVSCPPCIVKQVRGKWEP